MKILEGDQSPKLFNDYLICWRDFFLARAVIQVGKQKWGEERDNCTAIFLKFPPQRERDRTSTQHSLSKIVLQCFN